jgi:hypothetical protein
VTDRAALYTVAVRPRRGGPVALGDIDGAGTALGAVLAGILDGFSITSDDGARVIQTHAVSADGDDVFAIVQHGRRGVAADIVGPAGRVRLRQTPDDLQLVRCGCLFRLPARDRQGLLAVQLTYGLGVKDLFEQGLTASFRRRFPALTLVLSRVAEPDVLHRAVADDRVERVQLIGGDAPELDRWGARVRLAVELRAPPGSGLGRDLLGRYLAGDASALADIEAFAGVVFDRALIGVRLADGTRRTVDLSHPDRGGAASRVLDGIVRDGTGEATPASLLAALRAALVTQSFSPAK